MKSAMQKILFTWLVLASAVSHVYADYSSSANKAVQWLSSYQNGDGSWGATYDVAIPYTVEAVMALRAVSQHTSAYYMGVTWLENHAGPNVDYEARRILALTAHGDNMQVDLSYVQAAQMLTAPGNGGWGVTPDYQGGPMDSALALLACSQQGVTTNVQAALNYLKTAQLIGTDKGWALAQEAASDPVTTSLVIQALAAGKSLDPTVTTSITNGISALTPKVTAGSPTYLQALAALAYIRSGNSSNATALLNSLTTSQLSDGSWSEDIYATALAARAMAAAAGSDLASLSTAVYIPDPNLRRAINNALGKNAMDVLTEGDMANLISISAENMGITDLTGMEWAVNLVFADFQNNNITSVAPLSGLKKLTTLEWGGNPGDTPPSSTAVPAMSMPMLILTAGLLMLAGFFSRRRSPR
jgi:hypothetical protein